MRALLDNRKYLSLFLFLIILFLPDLVNGQNNLPNSGLNYDSSQHKYVPHRDLSQPYPNNQSPNGQTDAPDRQGTNPQRQSSSPSQAPHVIQPSTPDPNNNRQVNPDGSGTINPSRRDSLRRAEEKRKYYQIGL